MMAGTTPPWRRPEPGFHDRREAGRVLAEQLRGFRGRDDVLVLALPRGGAPVAREVAESLGAPLDVFVTRKLGVPGQEELAMGAVASGGVRVVNQLVLEDAGVSDDQLEAATRSELAELERRELTYRGHRPRPQIGGRVVILVDDGLATGASMIAALRALRPLGPRRLVVAVPTAPPDACAEVAAIADEVVCPLTPRPFLSVGQWYEDFSQTSDEEVRTLLTS